MKFSSSSYYVQPTFYTWGCLGLLWCILWLVLVSDDPKDNRWMSQTEKKEVVENRTGFTEGQQRPLAQMLKIISTPTLWFCAMDDFGSSLALNIVTVEGPTFIKEFLGKDISEVPFLFRP